MPRMPSVPLMSARPSLARSVTGSRPSAASASRVGPSRPSRSHTSPSPIRARAQWASGARSPLAPSEPCSRTTGVMPAPSRASCRSTSSGRAPERAIARLRARSSSMARTTSCSTRSPMPAAWDRTSATCSSAVRSGAITVSARAPKPVVTPYTGSPPATNPATSSAERSMAARAESASRACAPPGPRRRRRRRSDPHRGRRSRWPRSLWRAPVPSGRRLRPWPCRPPEPEPLHGRLLSGDGARKARHVATVGAWMLRTSW